LNPLHVPDPRLAQGIWEYSHSLHDATAKRSQKILPKIQNIRSISYCGAWTGNGSHEDGFSSGLSVAINHLGAKLPFEFVHPALSRTKTPTLTINNYLLRLVVLLVQIFLLLIERAWYAIIGLVDRQVVSQRKKA
jgi:predicted NAD/FAD-binding protein